jgi:hypothetical protein
MPVSVGMTTCCSHSLLLHLLETESIILCPKGAPDAMHNAGKGPFAHV